ncbi:hypothetical protein [Mahella sp.]|uniref:hypothetical protein n=1 Tax=Mahella sp. TaxID=2798721 RepID=UPI0025B8FE53|nr:hypothetical protein [Mahella sp.]MBZ4665026.1 hypothetical protein [Mahella sp.]MDK2903758.1 CRISPR-associated protein Csx10 [Clostridiales bacterium]
MKALKVDIHLLEPLILSTPGAGEENSAISQDYIPGSTILGIAANAYIKDNNIEDASEDAVCRRLFFEGSTCFLNAYIKANNMRFLPKPLSWFTSKDDVAMDKNKTKIYDFAVEKSEELESASHPNLAYCADEEDGVYMASPQYDMAVHNSSWDRREKSEGKSTVYRYESLAADQVFSGAVVCKGETDLEIINDLLNKKYFKMGASRTAGYGLVYIETHVEEDWKEYEPGEYFARGNKIIITLLSDTIIFNKYGQNTVNARDLFDVEPECAYYEPKVISGFNRKWGLPLPQMYGFRAGSVFVYSESNIDKAVLKQACMFGIGQRRAEGFGRIAVNWHGRASIKGMRLDEQKQNVKKTELSERSISMAKRLIERLWRDMLDDKLADTLQKLQIKGTDATRTQMARLRNVAHGMCFSGDKDMLLRYADGLKNTAKSQLEKVKLDSTSLYDWIREDFCDKVWNAWLRPEPEPKLGDIKLPEQVVQGLKIEYSARLLDGLLKKALKAGENK